MGVQSIQPIVDASVEEFDKLASVNVKGTFLCVQAVTRQMIKQESRTIESRTGPRSIGRGSIVNLGSGNSYVPVPGMVQYTSSKHAVMGVTKTAGKLSPVMECTSELFPSYVSKSLIILINSPQPPPSPRKRSSRHPRECCMPLLGRHPNPQPLI